MDVRALICVGLSYVTYRLARENRRLRSASSETQLTIERHRQRAADLQADNERLARQVRRQHDELRRLHGLERQLRFDRVQQRAKSTQAAAVPPADPLQRRPPRQSGSA